MIQKVDTLIVGAGLIGSSVAMHLALRGMKDVRVIDFDLEGSLSSSELNAGGVRATWLEPINIEMSIATIQYCASVASLVGYNPCGYLWLHPEARLKAAVKARELQMERGWPVEVWDVSELRRRVPFLDKTDGIEGAVYAPRDGLINPNLLKNHFRSIGRDRGVVYDDRTLLRAVKYQPEGQNRIHAVAERFEEVLTSEAKLEAASLQPVQGRYRQIEYHADRIVNCAGPWASHVAKILGYESPVFPMRRQISIFDCQDLDLTPYGMIVDTSGVYFHPEATHGLAGFANHHEPHGINYSYDGESFFMEVIWPALYERSSSFERLKHLTGWAGLYEVSPDECAVLGPVVQGEAKKHGRVFEAHSFSGHGVMHSYSAGMALAERIIGGRYETLDVSVLSASRFDTGQLIRENLII
jgi:glycine/D-amino acid oxidase-like deaminating enzyme